MATISYGENADIRLTIDGQDVGEVESITVNASFDSPSENRTRYMPYVNYERFLTLENVKFECDITDYYSETMQEVFKNVQYKKREKTNEDYMHLLKEM